jgi:Flp pilus assembly protein TadD
MRRAIRPLAGRLEPGDHRDTPAQQPAKLLLSLAPQVAECLEIFRELGAPYGQAESLRELGVTLRALGQAEEARAHLRQALALFEELQTADADQVRALLAE